MLRRVSPHGAFRVHNADGAPHRARTLWGAVETRDPAPQVLEWGTRLRLHVLEAGLACCAVEVSAAVARQACGTPREGQGVTHQTAPESPGERVDVLLVSGTVTDRVLPALAAARAALPDARVVAYGACTATGGPYWDSYSVTKGIDQVLPVDLYVPGCPPRPEALAEGLSRLEAALVGAP